MNTIHLSCQTLRKELMAKGCSWPDIIEILHDMEMSSNIAIQLVSDMLTQDKIEEGTMQLDTEPVGIWSVVNDCHRLLVRQVIEIRKTNTSNVSIVNDFYKYIIE